MSNYILKYSRDERVKYISHLDFVRMFHRAARRAELPFVFSQGFNPHPVMTVAQPLSVGVTADGEYMKVGFDGEFSPKELTDRLNAAMPPGFKILATKKVESKEIDLTKIDRAEYTVEVEYNGSIDAKDIADFMALPELVVMKKSKSGVKESDIRPYIYKFDLTGSDEKMAIFSMTLAVGSVYNLKPDSVIDAMGKYINGFTPGFFTVHRNSLLCGDKDYL